MHHPPAYTSPGDVKTIVNPARVGQPAYVDPTPPAHVSERGSPFAR